MTNWIQKIGNSVTGVIIGLILFLISLGILFWNEGRVNEADLARRAESHEANLTENLPEDKLVALTGETNSRQLLGDGLYVNSSEYLAIRRTVEMYAWSEQTEREGEEVVYTYDKQWVERPEDSDDFQQPEGHQNPTKTLQSETLINDSTLVGEYFFEAKNTGLTNYQELTLDETTTGLLITERSEEGGVGSGNNSGGVVEGESGEVFDPRVELNFVYLGKGNLTEPEIGDLRVSYEVVKPGETVTVFGKIRDNTIVPYRYNQNDLFYKLKPGTYDQAINSLNNDYNTSIWIFRAVGFVLMWISLLMLLSPVQAVLNVIPVVGSLAKSFFSLFTFLIALVIAVATVFFSIIVHNLFLMILIIVIFGGALAIYFYRKQHKLALQQQVSVQPSQIMNKQQVLNRQTGKVTKAAGVKSPKKKELSKKVPKLETKTKAASASSESKKSVKSTAKPSPKKAQSEVAENQGKAKSHTKSP